MKITVERHGKVTILRPQGNLAIGEGDVVLRDAFLQQLAAGNTLIVLDMKAVSYVDSAGLGELVASLKRTKEAGGSLKLAGLNQKVHSVMVLTKLIQILDSYPTDVEAVSSFVD